MINAQLDEINVFIGQLFPYVRYFSFTWLHLQAFKKRYIKEHNRRASVEEENKEKKTYEDISDAQRFTWASQLLAKLRKDIGCEHRDLFVNCIRSQRADSKCVPSQPDKKGKIRRIDCLRQTDKVWRLDMIMMIIFRGIPLENTDGERLKRISGCGDDLCVNPYHMTIAVKELDVFITQRAFNDEYNLHSQNDLTFDLSYNVDELLSTVNQTIGEVEKNFEAYEITPINTEAIKRSMLDISSAIESKRIRRGTSDRIDDSQTVRKDSNISDSASAPNGPSAGPTDSVYKILAMDAGAEERRSFGKFPGNSGNSLWEMRRDCGESRVGGGSAFAPLKSGSLPLRSFIKTEDLKLESVQKFGSDDDSLEGNQDLRELSENKVEEERAKALGESASQERVVLQVDDLMREKLFGFKPVVTSYTGKATLKHATIFATDATDSNAFETSSAESEILKLNCQLAEASKQKTSEGDSQVVTLLKMSTGPQFHIMEAPALYALIAGTSSENSGGIHDLSSAEEEVKKNEAKYSHQLMLGYHNISPESESPTPFLLAASPIATPKGTPRSTPVPRWCATPFFIDGDQETFAVMINMFTANTPDDTLIQESGCLENYLHSTDSRESPSYLSSNSSN